MNLLTKIAAVLILIIIIGVLIVQKAAFGQTLDFDVSQGKLIPIQEFLEKDGKFILLKFNYSKGKLFQYNGFFALAQKAKSDLKKDGWKAVKLDEPKENPDITINLTSILRGRIVGIHFNHDIYHHKIRRYDINFLEELENFLESIKIDQNYRRGIN